MNSPKVKFHLAGLKQILLPRPKDADLSEPSGPAHALFGPPPERAADGKSRGLVDFLKKVDIFKDLQPGDLKRLARIVHERDYRDGEVIYEQGQPGAALYLVRDGVVEIVRRKRNGEEVPLVLLEPPASLEEWAATGAEGVRLTSARARGPVSLVAIGHSDLEALSRNFPTLASKIVMKLAQAMAMRMQTFLETEFSNEESEP
jgi:CRP/FNR family transcriptional regulator, cyclic AMP receptor protein